MGTAPVVTINSVDCSAYVLQGGLTIDRRLNRATCRVKTLDLTDTFFPERNQTITVTYGGATLFSGTIVTCSRSTLYSAIGAVTEIQATDWGAICDQRVVTLAVPSGWTVYQVLDRLVTDYLAVFGISLSPLQEPGATLDAIDWRYKGLTACLNEIAATTNWFWAINASKELRMRDPNNAPAAPFTITDAAPNCIELQVDDDSAVTYANRVFVLGGGSGAGLRTQTWTADGSQMTYTADVPAVVGTPTAGYVTVGGIFKPVGITGVDIMEWTWDGATGVLTQRAGYGPEAASTVISLTYTGQYPFVASEEDGTAAANPRELVIDAPNAVDTAAANALAAGVLAQRSAIHIGIRVTTDEDGLEPGQILTVITDNPPLFTVFFLTAVTATIQADQRFRYVAEGKSGLTYPGDPNDLYRQWSELGTGMGGGTVNTVPPTQQPSPVAPSPIPLHGSRDTSVASSEDWTPIHDYYTYYIDGAQWPVARVRVDVKTPDTDTYIHCRLINLTDNTVAGQMEAVTAANWLEDQTFNVTLPAGWHKYRCEVYSATTTST